jgi:hydrogenase/urease accessory protein HupE
MKTTKKRISLFLLQCFSLLLILTTQAYSHDARPVAVTITEQAPLVYHHSVRAPPSVDFNNQPVLVWPSSCEATSTQSVMSCPEGIQGQALALDFPLYNPSLATFVRFNGSEGESTTMMLSPTESNWVLAGTPSLLTIANDYLVLGFEHILGGFDHLLFVLGLMVIAKTTRRILLTVTGFTVAHSITLITSAMGFITVPIVPVETTIALSILFLAYEISRSEKTSMTFQYPLLVSFGFGLLHGLGFASALSEIGLVSGDIILSLLFFNLGVEAGQLAFILLMVILVMIIKKIALEGKVARPGLGIIISKSDLLMAYAIGIPASFWVFERLATLLSL